MNRIEIPGDLFNVNFKAWHKEDKRWENFTWHDIETDESSIYINGNHIEEYEDLTIIY